MAEAHDELATSTLAVRVAASTRANLYDAVLCGLGNVSGPLRGSASRHTLELLSAAEIHGPARALGMAQDTVTVLFVPARYAGWVAHDLEELDEHPLPFRARAVYVS